MNTSSNIHLPIFSLCITTLYCFHVHGCGGAVQSLINFLASLPGQTQTSDLIIQDCGIAVTLTAESFLSGGKRTTAYILSAIDFGSLSKQTNTNVHQSRKQVNVFE